MYNVYGIPNCDTVQKSLNWFTKNKIPFTFHNYKKDGITSKKLKEWSKQVGWENLLNKKGSTWRALDKKTQSTIINQESAIKLLTEKTSVIKRPLIEKGDIVMALGFDETLYTTIFTST